MINLARNLDYERQELDGVSVSDALYSADRADTNSDITDRELGLIDRFSQVDDNSGIEDPIYRLGISYATGTGVNEDLITAHKWFNIAAMRGNAAARIHRAAVAAMLQPREIAKALKMARDWVRGERKGLLQLG